MRIAECKLLSFFGLGRVVEESIAAEKAEKASADERGKLQLAMQALRESAAQHRKANDELLGRMPKWPF